MADAVLRHLFAGFVRLHVLYHADKEPICGVEIMVELRHHGYTIGPGTLYPMLHALQKSGHLSCSEEVVAGKRRKNFRITSAGKKLLAKARAKLQELASEVVDDIDARVKLVIRSANSNDHNLGRLSKARQDHPKEIENH